MRDFSIVLPSWAVQLGYRLEGGQGTYDELFLYKDFNVVRIWGYLEKSPNVFELEDFIVDIESQKVI
jgi:hypothetical protein